MTYLEKITYLTGRFLQVYQYCLYNAYRVETFFDGIAKLTPQVDTEENIQALESRALSKLVANQGLGTKEILAQLLDHGMSRRDEKEFALLSRKKDYLATYYYLDNAQDLSREDPVVYAGKVQELQEYVDKAVALNQSLSKSADRIVAENYRRKG